MHRKTAWFALLAVGVGGALHSGAAMRARQDASDLAQAAVQLLHANTVAAPELHHLEAARARMYVDQALARHQSPRLRGLRYLMSALAYLQKADLRRAEQRLGEARTRLGDSPDVLALDAALASARGESRGARLLAKRALQADPTHLRARVLLVDLALDARQPEEALRLLGGLLGGDNDSASLQNRRGIALELQGKAAGARRAFETAGRLDGRRPDAHLNLGRALRATGQPKRALLSFLTASRLDAANPVALLGAGLCRLDMGDTHGARADFERAHGLGDGDASALMALGDLDMAAGDAPRALARFRAAVALDPDNAHAHLKLGNALFQTRAFDEATAAFRAAITLDGNSSAAHNGLGATLVTLGDRQGAAIALATAASLDASDPNPWLNLARLHQQGGDLDQARQAYAAARQRDPAVVLAGL